MGPGNSTLPSRPKFSWDIRSTPWTDGRGNREGFAPAVKLWEQFHEKLPSSNSNKITADLRGICLKSQLFGRALDLTTDKSTQSPLPLDPKPDHLAEYDWWQYGKGSHSSGRRRFLGSANITAISDSGRPILIRHLVVAGSSQWVIGRNVTLPSDIMHYGGSRILFPPVDGFRDSLSMLEGEMHSHVDIARFPAFCSSRQSASLACYSIDANSSDICEPRPWSVTKRVIDKVHAHTCGHASYADMRTLLQCDGFWTDDAQRYLADVIQRCEHCVATSVPPPPPLERLHLE